VDIVLVKAVPDRHEEFSRFSTLSGKTWNNPAIAGGVLLVRNEAEMAAFKIAPQGYPRCLVRSLKGRIKLCK